MDEIYASKPWLKFYDLGVPAQIKEYPRMSYADFIRESFEKYSGRVAVNYMGTNITFRALDALSNQFAHFIMESNCQAGDTVGVHMPNVMASYISCVGIQKVGCVFTGVSVLLTAEELEYQLNDSGAKILVTMDMFFETVKKVVAKTGVKTVIVASISDFLPGIKKVLGKLLKKIPTGEVTAIEGIKVIRFPEALKGQSTELVSVKVIPEDPCLMMYTGGTTGPPKGAVLTHSNVVSHLVQINAWSNLSPGEEISISAFPMFHQAGNFFVLLGLAFGTTTIALPNPRDLNYAISAIKKYKPTIFVNVPQLYLELMKQPKFRTLDFSSVKFYISGASPFPAENMREFEDIVGKGKLMEVFGMTETTPIITSNPCMGKKKIGSVGIPISDTEVKLVDPATGKTVPIGEPGEVVARGPQVFKGYHNKPEETAHALRDGWIYTGDICVMDEDGYFTVVDRLKDMVSVSGFKVFTRVVDDILIEHPDVDMAATIGLPNPDKPGSEIVASAIRLKPGREKNEAMRQNIINYMKERVAPYKVPKIIEFMDELPLSAVGKILKRELRKMMTAK